MGEEIKEKKFEILNYDELPKRDGIGALKGKKVIDWGEIVEGFIFKTSHEDYGYNEFSFVGYKKDKHKLYLRYDDKEYNINTSSFIYGNIGKIIGRITKEFKVKINTTFKDNGRDLTIIGREYKTNKNGRDDKWYKYKCNICDWSEGWIDECHLLKGIGCSCCCGRTAVLGINTIWDNQKHMVNLGVSIEDAKTHTKCSDDKITVKCPDCEREKKIVISNIYSRKSIGCTCGDGYSYPEKFMTSVLTQLGVKFETQYSPKYLIKDGSQKRSDFYIPSMKLIVEADGGLGHKGGKIHGKSNKTIEELINIDEWKDKQHLLNNIKTIRIDCSESDMEYIKNNILNSKLNELFDLSNIDWLKCEEYAINSNLTKVICDYWNNKKDDETTTDLTCVFGLSRTAINKYLKKGSKLGWCDYNPKEEQIKSSRRLNKNGKQVEMFKDGQSLGIFESGHELSRQSENLFCVKLGQSAISQVCLGKKPQYKGFTFKYISKEEYEEYLKSQEIKEVI